MTFTQWLRKVFGPRAQASRASRRGKSWQPSRHRFVPRLELLEDRLAPANTITVTGLGDSATITPLSGGSGTYTAVNLRSAVVGAEGLTGPDQIVFASNLFTSGPQTINLSVIGDTSAGPSALQINGTANITITGPTGTNGLTIARATTALSIAAPPPALPPNGATESGNTVTITTTATHPFTVGEMVTIAGVGVSGYNGTFPIFSVPSATTFTYTDLLSGLSSSGGGTASGNFFRLFDVAAGGNLTLQNLTLSNGVAQGFAGGNAYIANGGGGGASAGLGGAIFNQGSLTIQSSTLTGNTAQGGTGGSYINDTSQIVYGGGGGAGLGAVGGAESSNAGSAGGGPNGGGGGTSGSTSGKAGGFGGGGGGGYSNGALTVGPGGLGGFGGGGGGAGYRANGIGGNGTGGGGGFGGGGGGEGGLGGNPGAAGYGGGGGGGTVNGMAGGGGGAGMGGAIFNEAGTVVITNSTFTANTAHGGAGGTGRSGHNGAAGKGLGGGLFNHNGTITVNDCTFSVNTAVDGSGTHLNFGGRDVFNLGDSNQNTIPGSTKATATINNSILGETDTSVQDFTGTAVGTTGMNTATGSGDLIRNQFGFTGTIVQFGDPMLAALASNGGPTQTMAITFNSPAFNKGTNVLVPAGVTTDQRGPGFARIPNTNVDIGAFAVQLVLANIESSAVSYTIGTMAVNITQTLTATDNQSNLIGATVSITVGHDPNDLLNFTNQNGITGSYNSTTGVLTLTGTASVANYQAALRSITFSDSGGATGTRTVTFQVSDSGGLSNTQSRAIAVATTPTVTSPTATSITATTATLGGDVTSSGGAPLTQVGIVYALTSVNPNPTVGGAGVTQVNEASPATGVFTLNVSGLAAGSGYSFAAFATSSVGTGYSSVATFTTPTTTPTVTSPTATSITNTTANLGGDVTSNGGATLTQVGVVYALTSVNPNPTIGGTGVTQANEASPVTGVFTLNVSGLTANVGYSFAAFASNSVGTSYSPVATFATLNLITVTGLGDSATITPLSGGSGTYTAVNLRSAVVGAEGLTGPDQIVFASSLFTSGPQTIDLTVIGDTSAGPSALQINGTANITITGPTGTNGLTIARATTALSIAAPPPALPPNGATESGNKVTITTTATHPFTVGEMVTIAGVGVSGYNGTFAITSVPSATTFTYTDLLSGLSSSGGGTASGNFFRLFDVAAGSNLTLQDLTLSNGDASGFAGGKGEVAGAGGGSAGLGGAIFNQGSLTIQSSTLTGNTAQGGTGGSYPFGTNPDGGAGGAGLDGPGGPTTSSNGNTGGGPNGGSGGTSSSTSGGKGGFGGGGGGGWGNGPPPPRAGSGGAGGFGGGGGGGGHL
jgi:hypothetical protein